ncbi:MAG: WG repeat-containing protein [Muribaculaceae bacterium]
MADYDIFISYRRIGGADFARQMQLALKNKGYSVFLDFDELKDGVFDRRIEAAIKSSKVFLFILSPHALDRCKNEEDWVRKEIECAILSQCHIVPVNPNAVFQGFDAIDGLPYVIKNGLGQHQISTVMMNDLFECTFNEFVQRRIAPIVAPTKTAPHPDPAIGSEVHIETDIACRVMRFKEELITAVPDDDNLIHLKKGTHKLTFVSLENEQDNYSQVFTVKDDCEFLQVSLTKIRDTRLAKEEAERRAKEEAERRAKEEAERRAKEEAERRAKEEVARRAKEEAERRAREEAERKRIAEDDAKYKDFEANGRFGFKKDGVIVIPAIYDKAWYFHEGLAAVELNGKWGYIDKSGKEVIPFKYDDAWSFCEGLAVIKLNGKYGFIDKTGNEVTPAKYYCAWDFSEGLAKVSLNGKRGYIDKAGKEVIPIKFDIVEPFYDGKARVELNGKWGYIDKQGNFTPDK